MAGDDAAAARAKALFLARLAEKAERYDEMAEHLREASSAPQELSAEERHLLAAAHEIALARRRAACGSLAGAERLERRRGAEGRAAMAREYRAKVEEELHGLCQKTGKFLERNLSREVTDEAKAFYHKMKADNYRHLAAAKRDADEEAALEGASRSYRDAAAVANAALPETHPVSYGLALTRCVFQHRQGAGAVAAAPTPLRRAGGRGREAPSLSVASQRLCDLLLQFPSATAGGVPWSSLARAYADAYGEELDLAGLGYASAATAVRVLLAGMLSPRREGGRGSGASRPEDGAHAPGGGHELLLVDEVAMTPLLGYAASWPSLYSALCALVRSHGEQGGLLLSRMRPLLESLEVGTAKGRGGELSADARETLLQHLRPLALAGRKGSAAEGAGWAFLDEHGEQRQLQKIGQLVQAMLRWRYQRLRLLAKPEEPGPVEEALEPRLELAFARQFNNLVLRFVDEQEGAVPAECPEYYREYRPHRGPEPSASAAAPLPEAAAPLLSACSEKPRRSNSEPPQQFMIEVVLPPLPAPARGGSRPVSPSTPRMHQGRPRRFSSPKGERPPRGEEPEVAATATPEVRSHLRLGASPTHSPTAAARSRSRARARHDSARGRGGGGARARSLSEGPSAQAPGGEGAERSRSEPPHPRDVAVLDDPFEPPPQELWASSGRLEAAGAFEPFYSQAWPDPFPHGGAWAMPAALPGSAGLPLPWQEAVAWPGACWARAPGPWASSPDSASVRTRSLERTQNAQAQTLPGTPVAGAPGALCEGSGARSRSEPPGQRTVEIFDDPFEPPPQTLWASASGSRPASACSAEGTLPGLWAKGGLRRLDPAGGLGLEDAPAEGDGPSSKRTSLSLVRALAGTGP